MSSGYRIFVFCFMALILIVNDARLTAADILFFLLIAMADLIKTNHLSAHSSLTLKFALAEWALVIIASFHQSLFLAGMALMIRESLEEQKNSYQWLKWLPLVLPAVLLLDTKWFFFFSLYFAVCLFVSFLVERLEKIRQRDEEINDRERQTIYQLEKTQNLLVNQSKERERLADLRARNQIARELHDTIGHRIAGLYMQLQAAQKMKKENPERSDQLLAGTVEELSETMKLIHDTAHNLLPHSPTGLSVLRAIAAGFTFCAIDFDVKGDKFTSLTPRHWRTLETNLREALTNILKHSGASQVQIRLAVNDRFVRLQIQDNGQGTPFLEKHIGLLGMQERVEQMNGSFICDGKSGFSLVCLLPIDEQGGKIFASSHR
ncbi:MAG: sensor histidine kinase [Sporolactobacillus sp.]